MSLDPNGPCTLLSAATEIEAAGIVTALADYDVEASTVGGFTSGYKAEAPGSVQILVRRSDLDRARLALADIRKNRSAIDWSTIDVGEPDE
jgi:hypothetical protein